MALTQARDPAQGPAGGGQRTSHPEQMAPFMGLVRADPAFTTCLATVGNGEFMAVKAQA